MPAVSLNAHVWWYAGRQAGGVSQLWTSCPDSKHHYASWHESEYGIVFKSSALRYTCDLKVEHPTLSCTSGNSFLGHLTRRFLPGLGFLNMRSVFMKSPFLSIMSATSCTCWSTFVAAKAEQAHTQSQGIGKLVLHSQQVRKVRPYAMDLTSHL